MPKITIEFNSSEPNEVAMAQECLSVVKARVAEGAPRTVTLPVTYDYRKAFAQMAAALKGREGEGEAEALAEALAEARSEAEVEVKALAKAEVEARAQAELKTIGEMPEADYQAKAEVEVKALAKAEDAPRTVEPIITPKAQAAQAAEGSTAAESTTGSKPQATEPSSKPSRKSKKPTYEQFREAVKAAKDEHGADFCMEVVTSKGAPKLSTLLKTIGGVSKADYQELMEMLADSLSPESGDDEAFEETKADPDSLFVEPEPTKEEAEDLDDDGLDDDDLGEEDTAKHVDPTAVKAALIAYSKEHGKDEARKIMRDGGAKVIADVANLTQKQLTAILKKVS